MEKVVEAGNQFPIKKLFVVALKANEELEEGEMVASDADRFFDVKHQYRFLFFKKSERQAIKSWKIASRSHRFYYFWSTMDYGVSPFP
ncbi:hypothetical protein SUGI_0218950 [Cryptomeria japonica]|nr:hypothetical protein SUGI_0218950 [Cryptomeria japonica]